MSKSNEDKLQQIIDNDNDTYKLLTQGALLFASREKEITEGFGWVLIKEATAYQKNKEKFDEIVARFNARQDDLKNNKIYGLAKSADKAYKKTVIWGIKIWAMWTQFRYGNSGTLNGAQAAAVIPLALKLSAVVLTAGVISYFVYRYYEQTIIDLEEIGKMVVELSKTNPELAAQAWNDSVQLKKEEQQNSVAGKVGESVENVSKGFKTGIIIVAIAFAASLIPQNTKQKIANKAKSLTKKNKS